jgi:hypothetical protein
MVGVAAAITAAADNTAKIVVCLRINNLSFLCDECLAENPSLHYGCDYSV